MFEIILLVVLVIVAIGEALIIYRKMEQAKKYQDVVELYENWIESFVLTVEAIDKELDKIDNEGTFRSDDEVGYFYQAMYSLLKRLAEFGLTNEPEQVPDDLVKEDPEFYSRNKELVKRITKRRQDISIEDIQQQTNVVKTEIAKKKKKDTKKEDVK